MAGSTPTSAELENYVRRCYEYLSLMVPISQNSGMIMQADFDIRLQMWKACQLSNSAVNHTSDMNLMVMKSREFLDNPGCGSFEQYDVINATIMQDLTEMSQVLSAMIASIANDVQDAILTLGEDILLCAMDVLQTLVDAKCENYGQLQKALLRITRKRSLLPPYLLLSNVRRSSTYPVKGGGYADVYRGNYLTKAVALKVLRVGGQTTVTEDGGEEEMLLGVGEQEGVEFTKKHTLLCKEAMIWRQFDHRNILPFYGVSSDVFSPRFCLVSPWMENGDLVTYLRNYDSADRPQIIIMIADGLHYLHSFGEGIVHGDLRGANILVGGDGVPRLADFGLTQIVVGHYSSRLQSSSSTAGGVVKWQPPELITFDPSQDPKHLGIATKEGDVYSFSCVCMEVFTGKPPFADLSLAATISAVGFRGQKPSRPTDLVCEQRGLDDRMWQIMMSCWEREPVNRPTMSQVLEFLYAKNTVA